MIPDINIEDITAYTGNHSNSSHIELVLCMSHDEILQQLKKQVSRIDFQAIVYPDTVKLKKRLDTLLQVLQQNLGDTAAQIEINNIEKSLTEYKVQVKHYIIISIEEIISLSQKNNWGMCINNDFIYLYNGAYWKVIDREGLQKFFGEVAELLGVPKYEARHYPFRESLLKQFYSTAHLARPPKSKDKILFNFLNGTLEIKTDRQVLRSHKAEDFLTYQLPFNYDEKAICEKWQKFLNEVLPDDNKSRQNILSEYLSSAFITNKILKLEKVLMLYGTGSNGKSVINEVTTALFGTDNVSNYSMQSLTDENGYYRAMITNKLLNYSSENGARVDPNFFKQLASGEPVPARLPYGEPFQATDYAKLIFNTNRLPKEGVEQTDAFFRRFLIIPFNVVISAEKQDRQLHIKIINSELPGVFNWVIKGLNRLLTQQGFTDCEAVNKSVSDYRELSDSVRSFISDKGYQPSITKKEKVSELYRTYKDHYCIPSGLKPVSIKEFSTRLTEQGYISKKESSGNYFSIEFKPGEGF